MAEIDRFLDRGEDIEVMTRKHPSMIYGRVLAFLIAAALGSVAGLMLDPQRGDDAVDIAAGIVVGYFALRLMAVLLRWLSGSVVLTGRRLLVASGLFSRKVTSIPLSRISEVTLSRSFFGRLQRFGDLDLRLSDGSLLTIERIPRVKGFYRLLASHTAGGEQRDDEADTGELPRVTL